MIRHRAAERRPATCPQVTVNDVLAVMTGRTTRACPSVAQVVRMGTSEDIHSYARSSPIAPVGSCRVVVQSGHREEPSEACGEAHVSAGDQISRKLCKRCAYTRIHRAGDDHPLPADAPRRPMRAGVAVRSGILGRRFQRGAERRLLRPSSAKCSCSGVNNSRHGQGCGGTLYARARCHDFFPITPGCATV